MVTEQIMPVKTSCRTSEPRNLGTPPEPTRVLLYLILSLTLAIFVNFSPATSTVTW
jgi:hypothetical protein